jgi:hypothetical protein
MCASHTLAHVLGSKYQEGPPTIRYAGPGQRAHPRGEANDPRMMVLENGNRTRKGERTAAQAEFRSLRYVTSMLAVSKSAKVVSLVNQKNPCS